MLKIIIISPMIYFNQIKKQKLKKLIMSINISYFFNKVALFIIVSSLILPSICLALENITINETFNSTQNIFRINEIMYNPLGSDSNQEFIEVFHIPWINLSNFILSDGKNNETIIPLIINIESTFSLIVEDDSTLILPNVSIYITDSTLGYAGLGNNDIVSIFNPQNTTIFDIVPINSSIANNNGFSMEFFNQTFYESIIINGTPGYQNSINSTNQIPIHKKSFVEFMQNEFFIGKIYENLFKIILDKENCSVKENISYSYNISKIINQLDENNSNSTQNITSDKQLIESTNWEKEIGCSSYAKTGILLLFDEGNYSLCIHIFNSTNCQNITAIDPYKIPCNVSIDISTNSSIFNKKIEFFNTISNDTFDYTIEYWVEDIFGNVIKQKTNTTNDNKKSYTPIFKELDKAFLLKNKLFALCNNSSPNTSSEKLVAVIGSSIETEITIDSVNKEIIFGDTINLKLSIDKGDTTKYSIKVYIDKITEIYYIRLYEKNTQYQFSIPLITKDNCDNKSKEGKYTLIIDGLDTKIEEDIFIKNSICKKEQQINKKELKINVTQVPFFLDNNNDISILIDNQENIPHKIMAYSYIYRGSKSYSGDRTSNNFTINIPQNSKTKINLTNKLDNITNGNYSLKIRIFIDDKKTPIEYTYDTKYLKETNLGYQSSPIKYNELLSYNNTNISNNTNNSNYPINSYNQITGMATYISRNETSKSLIMVFFVVILMILLIFLLQKSKL